MNLIVRKLMKLFNNLFKGNKLNANEIAICTDSTNSKYKNLDTYIGDIVSSKTIYKSGNGYIMFADGTMVCYGNYTESSTSYNDYYSLLGISALKKITLPQKFSNTSYRVELTPQIYGNISAIVESKTTSTISIRVFTHHQYSNYGSGTNVDYIAIGKWK